MAQFKETLENTLTKLKDRYESTKTGGSKSQTELDKVGDIVSTPEAHDVHAIMAISLLILACGAMGLILYALAGILVPFFLSIFLTYLLRPIVDLLLQPPRAFFCGCCTRQQETDIVAQHSAKPINYSALSDQGSSSSTPTNRFAAFGRFGSDMDDESPKLKRSCSILDRPLMPRILAVFLTFLFVFSLLGGLCFVVQQSLVHLEANLPLYHLGANELGTQLQQLATLLHFDLAAYVAGLQAQIQVLVPTILAHIAKDLGYSFFIIIFLIYLLMSPIQTNPDDVLGKIDQEIKRWIQLKTMICLTVGVLTFVILKCLGVDVPMVFGLLAFVFNYVPNIGPSAATLLPMGVVILNPNMPMINKILAFLLPTMLHMIIGNFVEPMVMGEHLKLTPVCVLLALAFWFELWGVPGMLMAVPIMSMIRIVCVNFKHPYAEVIVSVLEGTLLETIPVSKSSKATAAV